MATLLPVALYGLEVPAGEIMIPAAVEFPATIRITMAAIDPTEEIDEEFKGKTPRSTLKLIKQRMGSNDEDEDDDEDDYLQALLANGEDDDSDEDEEESNGGPSDPAKSKKARQEAAIKKLLEATKDESDEEMEEAGAKPNGKSKKGKQPATDEDESDDEDDESDEDGLDLEQYVVCTLDTDRTYQQPLDITIGEGEKVFFVVSGTHTIHLTGNYVIDSADDESEEDEDDEDDYDLPPGLEDLLDDEAELSDELDEVDADRIQELDTDDEEAPQLVASKKGKNKRAAEDAEDLDGMIAKETEVKLSKKQLKKLKNNKGDAIAVEEVKAAAKETPKSDKKVQFAKNLEQGPTGSAEKAKADGKPAVGVKVVQGVTVDDRKIGTGRTAKNGDTVGMRYIGKLQSNGKVFDSNKKGKPFSFKLGKGEVIKGWDIGINGMAIGGERRLTIPAKLAYGSKSMADIPANSTLVFDVKLLEIK